jgi:hypothetical protein
MLFQGVVGESEHHHLPWCIRSLRLCLFLSLWLNSRPRDLVYCSRKFFASWRQFAWMNANSVFLQLLHSYVDCPRLPLNLMWSSLLSIPRTKFPRMANSCLRKTSNANRQPYLVDLHPPGNCWFTIVKSYQAPLIWYLVDLPLWVSRFYDFSCVVYSCSIH